jgi:hypothetical protein
MRARRRARGAPPPRARMLPELTTCTRTPTHAPAPQTQEEMPVAGNHPQRLPNDRMRRRLTWQRAGPACSPTCAASGRPGGECFAPGESLGRHCRQPPARGNQAASHQGNPSGPCRCKERARPGRHRHPWRAGRAADPLAEPLAEPLKKPLAEPSRSNRRLTRARTRARCTRHPSARPVRSFSLNRP